MRALQVPVRPVKLETIMRDPAFERGVQEVRDGRSPRFDRYDSWEYERGRQWATVAPKNMPLKIGRKLNPAAVAIFRQSPIP